MPQLLGYNPMYYGSYLYSNQIHKNFDSNDSIILFLKDFLFNEITLYKLSDFSLNQRPFDIDVEIEKYIDFFKEHNILYFYGSQFHNYFKHDNSEDPPEYIWQLISDEK